MAEPTEVEKGYEKQQTAAKLRRLAEAMEEGTRVGGQRIYVPPTAEIVFEYERGEDEDELEIEIKWARKASGQA